MAEKQVAVCKIKLRFIAKHIQDLNQSLSQTPIPKLLVVVKYKFLESNFMRAAELLETLGTLSEEDLTPVEWERIQSDYYDIAAQIKELKNPPNVNAGLLSETPGSSRNLLSNSTVCERRKQVKLPTAKIPTFNGEYESWLSFKQAFVAFVDSDVELSVATKLSYLRDSLTDDAFRKVDGFSVGGENYTKAWQTLIEAYEHKRILVSKHLDAILDLSKPKDESARQLTKLIDEAKRHLNTLESLDIQVSERVVFRILERALPQPIVQRWEKSLGLDELLTLKTFYDFIQKVANQIINIENNNIRTKPETTNKTTMKQGGGSLKARKSNYGSRVLIANTDKGCVVCGQEHTLFRCPEFNGLSISKRWQIAKNNNLCNNCLRLHPGKCTLSHCKLCSKFHNTLLHSNSSTSTKKEKKTGSSNDQPSDKENTQASVTSLNCSISSQLLMSAVVKVYSNQGKPISGRILLDTGATHSFITEKLTNQLRLKIKPRESFINGFGNNQSKSIGTVQLRIQSRINDFSRVIQCIVVKTIAKSVPSEQFPRELIEIPNKLKLADPKFHVSRPIDIVLSSGISLESLSIGRIHLKRDSCDLHFQKTQFGWIIVGGIIQRDDENLVCNLVDLETRLKQFWEIEDCSKETDLSFEEASCESHYAETVKRESNGRYVVRLPFRTLGKSLGDSKSQAHRQIIALSKRFDRDPQLKLEYYRVMQEYIELGHMTEVQTESANDYYMPHHAVIKPDSTTTKTRVVFNASAKTTTGQSLNYVLMVGPTIQAKLASHLIRFRSLPFALTADIEKMYRQILVHPQDRSFQKIFWFVDNKIKTSELNTVTFGVASAPFLAIRTLHQLASDEADNFPRASNILKNNFYVDDLLCGANTIEEIRQIRSDLTELIRAGGFVIRKWVSNCDEERLDDQTWDFDNDHTPLSETMKKALGLHWNSKTDEFVFFIKPINVNNNVTKRSILSAVAGIFDPMGLLGPLILFAKTIMQECWKAKVGWDESITLDLYSKWKDFVNQLPSLENYCIPRCLVLTKHLEIELHGFCDASKVGYGACVYVRSVGSEETLVRLACSKSRVAPIKEVTIPRLELCAAVLLAQVISNYKDDFQFLLPFASLGGKTSLGRTNGR